MRPVNYPNAFPVLDYDAHYILREQTLEDTENFFRYYTDPEVGKHILATKPATLLDASREVQYCRNLYYSRQGMYWALAKKSDNQMIGAIGLYANNVHHRAEITYDLSRDYWRHGIMKKAMQAVMTYAFQTMYFARLEAVTRTENKASVALLKSLHFVHEGTLKKYRFYHNQMWDIEMFAATSV